ncbi:hypothetical protein AB6A40_000378 [Gnathostoma spinigerum]|uniref:ANK_REP_REGION domain-containing protein n=1 Tax=Gnathostoma spinigerum TaxID=75299 RepID=A0ABD6E8J0_9BILA
MTSAALVRAIDASDVEETARILEAYSDETNARADILGEALRCAAENVNAATIRRILELDASIVDCEDENGYTPLLVASMSGNIDALKELVTHGAQISHIDKDKHTALHWAVVCGQIEIVEFLLQEGASINACDAQEAQALHYATIADDIPTERALSILHILLKHGANVNAKDLDGRTPVLWAASNGSMEALTSLLQSGGDRYTQDRDQLGVLHCAASNGHDKVIQMIIESSDRSIIDAVDRNGDTPLFYAVTLGHYECARLLLMNKADPNHQDYRLRSPSHCAAAKGQLRMLKMLKQFGASLEIQNHRGDIPLHEAVQSGSKDTIEWLLAMHPTSVNSSNHEGRTSLHLAAASGNLEVVVLLCYHHALIDPLMLYEGTLCTPLDLAERKKQELVVEYLTHRHGAHRAADIPDEHRKNSMARLEDQVRQAEQVTSDKIREHKFSHRFLTTKHIPRRKSCESAYDEDDMGESSETDDSEARECTHQRSQKKRHQKTSSRRASTGSCHVLEHLFIPKSTSTTDLQTTEKGSNETLKDDDRISDEEMQEKIMRIVKEEVQRSLEKRTQFQNTATSNEPSRKTNLRAQKKKSKAIEKKIAQIQKNAESFETSETYEENSVSDGDNSSKENGEEHNQRSSSPHQKTVDDVAEHSRIAAGIVRQSIHAVSRERNSKVSYEQTVVEEGEEETADDDGKGMDVDEKQKLSRGKSKPSKRTAISPGKKIAPRYFHEKVLFDELTHLKRIQIQYGKVQEKVLVRTLINNFCKMHNLSPAHFNIYSFYAWEKFLYDQLSDQLKLLYLEERRLLMNPHPPNGSRDARNRFETRLRRARPVPVAEMTANSSPSTVASTNSQSSRRTILRSPQPMAYGRTKHCDCGRPQQNRQPFR